MMTRRSLTWFTASLCVLSLGLIVISSAGRASAATPSPGPKSGSVGVEGTIASPPPTQPATIAQPANGANFSTIPITVSGTCPRDTIVKVFSNNIFVGSGACTNGSYTFEVALFSGRNDLIAQVFDALDQQGPNSNAVTVNYTDAQFAQFGSHVLVTSQYARRAADPNTSLEWPVILSGGLGPYAISIDWGDGSALELHSEPFAGNFTYKHLYKTAGLYKVTFSAVDGNNTNGYLQVVGVVTGTVGTNTVGGTKNDTGKTTTVTQTKVLWQPTAGLIVLAVVTFWLGRRFELASLRKRLEQNY